MKQYPDSDTPLPFSHLLYANDIRRLFLIGRVAGLEVACNLERHSLDIVVFAGREIESALGDVVGRADLFRVVGIKRPDAHLLRNFGTRCLTTILVDGVHSSSQKEA